MARLAAVVLLLAAQAIAPIASAAAAVPVPGEYIFVQTPNNHAYFLYAANATTGSLRQVTAQRAVGRPSFSPDGTRIVFSGPITDDSDGRYGLYTVSRTGTGLRRITAPTFADSDPAWSPNGAWIAFSRDRFGNSSPSTCCRLALVRPDGSSSRWIGGTDGASFPTWSPDSSRIAYVRPDGLYVINTDGSGRRRIATGRITTPKWSPDGRSIAYAQRIDETRSQLRVIPAGGGRASVRWAPSGHVESPSWGADGRTLHVVAHWGWGDWARRSSAVYRVPPTGSASKQVDPARQVYFLDYHHHLPSPGRTGTGLVETTATRLSWRLNNELAPPVSEPTPQLFGAAGDRPVTGDWNGDGTASLGAVRVADAQLDWYLGDDAAPRFRWGIAGDIPVSGDWNGDGIDTAGVVRVVDGRLLWYITNRTDNPVTQIRVYYGLAGDIPVTGDWDGDGITSIGVARPSGASLEWHLSNTTASPRTVSTFEYGVPTDRPLTGDWDANRSDSAAVARATESGEWQWWFRRPGLGSLTFTWGPSSQAPVTGDWDGR